MTGDIIARVDHEQVQGDEPTKQSHELVGEVRSTVSLPWRAGCDKADRQVSIVRDNTTRSRPVAGGEGGEIGYIRIIRFNEADCD